MDALDKALAKINPPEINYLKDLDRRTCYIGERILRNGLVKRPFEVPRPTKFNVAEFHNTSLSDADVNGVLQVTNQYDLIVKPRKRDGNMTYNFYKTDVFENIAPTDPAVIEDYKSKGLVNILHDFRYILIKRILSVADFQLSESARQEIHQCMESQKNKELIKKSGSRKNWLFI